MLRQPALDGRSPTFLAPQTSFMEDNFSTNWEEGDGFGMSQGYYIYCTLRSSLVAQTVKNLPAMQETCRRPRFDPWVGRISCRRE